MKTIDFIVCNYPLCIVSGEGEQGTIEPYKGTKTVRALRSRLKRERAGGRWARAEYKTGRTDEFGTPEWSVLNLED